MLDERTGWLEIILGTVLVVAGIGLAFTWIGGCAAILLFFAGLGLISQGRLKRAHIAARRHAAGGGGGDADSGVEPPSSGEP